MKIVVARIYDEVSDHDSIGAGQTCEAALEDAIARFVDKPEKIIRERLKSGAATVVYMFREV